MPTPRIAKNEPDDPDETADLDPVPREAARFNRARMTVIRPLPVVEDEASRLVADETETDTSPDLRLAEEALLPGFAPDSELALLEPNSEPDSDPEPRLEPDNPPAAHDSQIAAFDTDEKPVAPQWRAAAPLVASLPAQETVESEPLTTQIVAAPPTSPVSDGPASTDSVVRNSAARPIVAPDLSLRWIAPNETPVGKFVELTLLVTNRGDAPAEDVTLMLNLPRGVEHKQGRKLQQSLGQLTPDQSRRITLFVRPLEVGELVLPVEARAGDARAKATGYMTVAAGTAAVEAADLCTE